MESVSSACLFVSPVEPLSLPQSRASGSTPGFLRTLPSERSFSRWGGTRFPRRCPNGKESSTLFAPVSPSCRSLGGVDRRAPLPIEHTLPPFPS